MSDLPFDSAAIDAAARAAKADPSLEPEFLAAVYPFLQWRAERTLTLESLFTAADLAHELVPWVLARLRRWQAVERGFMGHIWLHSRWRMAQLVRRHGRLMRRPWHREAMHALRFTSLDSPAPHSENGETLGDTLAEPPPPTRHGALYELPLDRLTTLERELIEKHYFQNKSIIRLARERGCSKQNVSQLLAKAVRHLRRAVDHQMAEALAAGLAGRWSEPADGWRGFRRKPATRDLSSTHFLFQN